MATITGTALGDIADASAGTLTGFTGATLVELQDSIGDSFLALDGGDTIIAGSGNDTIRGGLGIDVLNGGNGNDIFTFLNDTVSPQELVSGETISGGIGTDTLQSIGSGTRAYLNLTSISLDSVEVLQTFGGQDSITLTGDQFMAFDTIDLGGGTTDTMNVIFDGTYDITGANEPALVSVERLVFTGGANNDTLTISTTMLDAANTINLGTGTDTLIVKNTLANFNWNALFPAGGFTSVDKSVVDDSDGSNVIDASITSRSMTVYGNGGNDTITTYSGSDSITGGAGNDSLNGGSVTSGGTDYVYFSGPLSNYAVTNLGGNVYILTDTIGTDGSDTISNFEFAVFGNDTISTSNLGGTPPVSATFTGTTGNDVADVAGTGTLTGFTGGTIAQLQDGTGDVFLGSAGDDYINAGAGNDTIYGSAGADTIIGNDGADLVSIGTGDFEAGEYINCLAGLDTLVATGTVDFTLGFVTHFGRMSMGDAGANVSVLSSQLFGLGFVTITGGAGTDTLNIVLNAESGPNATLTPLISSGIENLNIIDAIDVANSITATNYADSVSAAGGADSVNGGTGNDTIIGGAGNDTLAGAGGTGDIASYSGALANYTVTNNGNGTYTVAGAEGTDTLSNIEFVRFGGTVYDITTLGNGGGNSAPVGTNDTNGSDPVVEAGGVNNATAGDPSAAGNVLGNDSDPNAGDTLSVTGIRTGTEAAGGTFTNVAGATTIAGIYGTLTINPDGSYSYALSNADSDTQGLRAGINGTETFTYLLADNGALTDTAQITVTIAGSNDAPTLAVALGDQNATSGSAFSYTVPGSTFADVDVGDTRTLTATLSSGAALPAWLTFNAATGQFSGTPGAGDVGTITVRVTATDGGGLSTFDDFVITTSGSGGGGSSINGTSGADNLSGTAGNDTISGLGGSDSLSGLEGSDSLSGGNSNDTLVGGAGGDTLDGGGGTDFASYAGSSAVTITISSTGVVTGSGGDATGDTFAGIERFIGSGFNDTFNGNASSNYFAGSGGGDTINGQGGKDTLLGDDGNDLIIGGTSTDTMTGGAGSDTFDFNATGESGTSNSTRDQIADFTVNSDFIDLSTIDAKAGVAGNDVFAFIGTAAFTAEGQIRVLQSGADTIVQVNTSGTGTAEMEIVLQNVTPGSLDGLDFIL